LVLQFDFSHQVSTLPELNLPAGAVKPHVVAVHLFVSHKRVARHLGLIFFVHLQECFKRGGALGGQTSSPGETQHKKDAKRPYERTSKKAGDTTIEQMAKRIDSMMSLMAHKILGSLLASLRLCTRSHLRMCFTGRKQPEDDDDDDSDDELEDNENDAAQDVRLRLKSGFGNPPVAGFPWNKVIDVLFDRHNSPPIGPRAEQARPQKVRHRAACAELLRARRNSCSVQGHHLPSMWDEQWDVCVRVDHPIAQGDPRGHCDGGQWE